MGVSKSPVEYNVAQFSGKKVDLAVYSYKECYSRENGW